MGAKKLKIEDIQFFTMKQVAEITSFHEKTLYKFLRNGSLSSVKIKGKRLVSAGQLKKFLEASVTDGTIEV